MSQVANVPTHLAHSHQECYNVNSVANISPTSTKTHFPNVPTHLNGKKSVKVVLSRRGPNFTLEQLIEQEDHFQDGLRLEEADSIDAWSQ